MNWGSPPCAWTAWWSHRAALPALPQGRWKLEEPNFKNSYLKNYWELGLEISLALACTGGQCSAKKNTRDHYTLILWTSIFLWFHPPNHPIYGVASHKTQKQHPQIVEGQNRGLGWGVTLLKKQKKKVH